jgi:uncharacterized membrane protein YeiH
MDAASETAREAATLLIGALDLVGTVVFAMSGAMEGVRRGTDVFGALALAFVTATFGSVVRDVVLGSLPPAAVASWHPLALALVAGSLTLRFHASFRRLRHPVQALDAIGLGIFAVAGTQKALYLGVNWPMAAVIGMISGIGGGMVRDMLTARTPIVLVDEIYALAALAAGLVVVAGSRAGLPSTVVTLAGAALCMSLRLVALSRGWRLPRVRATPGA